MDSIRDYLVRTNSATQHLFNGVDELVGPIRHHRLPVFVGWGDSIDPYTQWATEHQDEVRESIAIQEKYVVELSAIAALCGAILQIAFHAFQLCSTNTAVAEKFGEVITAGHKAEKFCVGRIVKGVPLGLMVYVGRNQHMHFEDASLKGVTRKMFDVILTSPHEGDLSRLVLDEHLLTEAQGGRSMAKAFIDLMRWHSYGAYERDLLEAMAQV